MLLKRHAHRSWLRLLATLLVLAVFTMLPVGANAAGDTVLDVGYAEQHFKWVDAVNSAELTKTLTEHGPFTLFVPTDAAFAAAPTLFANKTTLRQTVLFHMLQGRYTIAQLAAQPTWTTAFGTNVDVAMIDGTLVINNQLRVIKANLPASNGIVHIVDAVGTLPDAYHTPLAVAHNPVPMNALDVLAKDDNCTMFVSLIEEMGMEHLLNEKTTFTVFVPTDDVFAAIDAHTMGAWHSNHTTFKQRMLYHIIPGGAYAANTNGTFNTALGKSLTMDNGMVDGAARIVGSTEVGNGILHMVTNVLTPPENVDFAAPTVHHVGGDSLLGVMERDGRLDMFVNEVEMSGLENLLTRHGRFSVFAPTDAAYAAMDADLMTACMVDHRLMKQLTLYHIVRGDWEAGTNTLPTALGETFLTKNVVIMDEISAENGTIYIIDAVQIPEMLTR